MGVLGPIYPRLSCLVSVRLLPGLAELTRGEKWY